MSEHLASVGSRAPAAWARDVPAALRAAWRPRPVTLGDGTWTSALELGEGPALVLLPPLVGWKEAFWPQVAGLSSRFRVVTFDLRERAFGRRGRGPARLGWEALLDDLDHVTRSLCPGRLALLGHSLGGMLALQWAERRPERVAALVLSSTYTRIRFDPSAWWSRFAVQGAVLASQRWLPEAAALAAARGFRRRRAWVYDRHCDDAVLRLVRAGARATPWRVAAARVRLARAFDAAPLLSAIRCPTLVVVGAEESRFARESAAELAGGIPGAERRTLGEANHLLHLSRAAAYNDAVGEWLWARRTVVED